MVVAQFELKLCIINILSHSLPGLDDGKSYAKVRNNRVNLLILYKYFRSLRDFFKFCVIEVIG